MVSKRVLRKALRASIEHWYENLSAACAGFPAAVLIHGDFCPLCAACGRRVGDTGILVTLPDCASCPVGMKAKRGHCMNTPWPEVLMAKNNCVLDGDEGTKALIKAIVKEICFLESLWD